MSNGRYVNVTDARKKLFDIVEETQTNPLPVHLTVRGVPAAVIVSQEEYESWMATLETLSDPELMEGIEEATEDVKAGRVISLDQMKHELDGK